MTDRRFTMDNGSHEDVTLVDNLTGREYTDNFSDIVQLMNRIWEQSERVMGRNDRLHKDWDRLYTHLTSEGLMTEEEILKVIGYE